MIDQAETFQVPRYLGLHEIEKKKSSYRLTLGFSKSTKRVLDLDEKGLRCIRAFLKPAAIPSVAKKLGVPLYEMRETVFALERQGILKKVFKPSEKMQRYDRHLLFFSLANASAAAVQKRISDSRIALIGMGGIGNWVSSGFIGSGFKELRLIDFDRVELSNLTRQVLFSEKDVGRLKTAVAAERLSGKNKHTKITTVHHRVSSIKELKKVLRGIDFVVLSADRPAEIHDWVDACCVQLKIPYLNIGYRDGQGVIGPLTVPGKTSCYQCFKPKVTGTGRKLNPMMRDIADDFERNYQAPSFGPLNALISSLGTVEIMKYLGKFGTVVSLDHEVTIDPLNLSMTTTAYSRDRQCWHCGKTKA